MTEALVERYGENIIESLNSLSSYCESYHQELLGRNLPLPQLKSTLENHLRQEEYGRAASVLDLLKSEYSIKTYDLLSGVCAAGSIWNITSHINPKFA